MESTPDFDRLIFSWACVIKADIKDIERVKSLIKAIPGVVICYQTLDSGKLFIVRENERKITSLAPRGDDRREEGRGT